MLPLVAAVATVLGVAVPTAPGQCRLGWKFGEQQSLPGLSVSPRTGVVLDDGGGGALYVAAHLGSIAGNLMGTGVARWDGNEWSTVGNLPKSHLTALIVYQDQLIAGGFFTLTSGEQARVIRWDGQAWVPMSEGLSSTVGAFVIFEGRLMLSYIGANNGPSPNPLPEHWIHEWDGSRWVPWGRTPGYRAFRFAVYQGELFAKMLGKRPFQSWVHRWNGDDWEPVGEIDAFEPNGLVVYQDKLLVGSVRSAGVRQFGPIVAWDGVQWLTFGGSIPGGVNAMEVIDGRLYMSGRDGSRPYQENPVYLATWVGNGWQQIGEGLLRGSGRGIFQYDGELMVSGVWDMESGALGIARYIGESWEPLGNGLSDQIHRFGVHRGELYAYGEFGRAGTVGDLGGLARWNGSRWGPVGSGNPNDEILEFASFGDDLIAVGEFTEIGGIQANRIARWDGTAWSAMGAGADAPIHSATVYKGDLVVVGEFTTMDGVPAEKVAIWDGQSWQQLGSGFDDVATSAYVHEGTLFVGGNFRDSLAGTRLQYMAKWDDTHQWAPLQIRLNGWAKRMASFRGDLVLLSRHRWRGGRMSVSGWNGSEWYEIAELFSGDARDLAVYRDELYITGDFYTITGAHIPMQRIARWDGRRWRSVGGGLGPPGVAGTHPQSNALAVYEGELVIGGAFKTVEGKVSAHWARWGCVSCYADCDENTGAGVLDIWDFMCFQRSFIAGDPYACDCDTSTGAGVCDVFDFLCFQNTFVAGCP
jgi:trimeric autotransporter adhesin